ncbi:MAG: hypothetical protein LH616_15070, partial [Ilumatobacteraceae bacterium]|nr:hypothetical protein [Ilumatobacteraceae bacterium]
VNGIIAAADTIDNETEAVPADRGVQLDFLAKLANLFPATWEVWLFADSLVPHRVEVAYARHRACVVPLLEAVLEARDEFPTSPDRLLRTLATSFLLKDFDAMRRAQRDLPARLEPIRQQAREVKERFHELEATKRKLQSELREVSNSRLSSFFSSMKGRTRDVIESELREIDEKISTEKQTFAQLEHDCPNTAKLFAISRGDPAVRAILEAIDGEGALLDAVPTATATKPKDEIGQPSFAALPEADGTAPEHVEVEPWEVARRWAARHRHVVYWLLIGVTFPIGLIVFVGVAATGQPLAAVCGLPFAFLPLVFFGLAIERTKKLAELRRLIVGRWQAKRADGVWQLQFTDDGKVLVNDALTADYKLFGNLDLTLSAQNVLDVMEEWVVSLDEKELIVHMNGAVCRFTRLTPLKPKALGLG